MYRNAGHDDQAALTNSRVGESCIVDDVTNGEPRPIVWIMIQFFSSSNYALIYIMFWFVDNLIFTVYNFSYCENVRDENERVYEI